MCFVVQLICIVAVLMLAASVIFMFVTMFDNDAKSVVTHRKVLSIFVIAILAIFACGAIYDAKDCIDEEPCCQKECKYGN